MIKQMTDMPENVLAFTASGTVTAKDYETVLTPAVEAVWARKEKVRFLYFLGADFDGFEAGAMWDDAKLGLKHYSGWERIAVVTDAGWIRTSIKVFSFAIPGHVRVFHNRELDEAITWVSE